MMCGCATTHITEESFCFLIRTTDSVAYLITPFFVIPFIRSMEIIREGFRNKKSLDVSRYVHSRYLTTLNKCPSEGSGYSQISLRLQNATSTTLLTSECLLIQSKTTINQNIDVINNQNCLG